VHQPLITLLCSEATDLCAGLTGQSPLVCDSDQLAHIVALITHILEAAVLGQSGSDGSLFCCFSLVI
jgi:hypothetical protein